MRLLAICLALLLGACATPQALVTILPPIDGTCLAMAAHLPQKTRMADTHQTKVDAYRRNKAFTAVCGKGAPRAE